MGPAGLRRSLSCLGAIAGLLCAASPVGAAETYVDCSAAPGGTGYSSSPLSSIAGTFDLGPGDSLLFRRGTTCEGELRVEGGGTSANPAAVSDYGQDDLRPRIVGTGWNAVRVEDASHISISNLDISNPGSGEPLGEATVIRNGIMVTAQSGPAIGVTLAGLNIHDVAGDLTKNPQGSAAIQISAMGPPPARFVDLRITANSIHSVSRSAISVTGTNAANRPAGDEPWPEASTGMRIVDNRIDEIAGDGIVTRGTDGALVQGNKVHRGNLSGRPLVHPDGPMCNAGIWAFRANNTLIRGNEVSGMEHNGCDGTGFDVDYRQDGTVIEGNYSHDNEGGFVLLCTDEEIHRADVRFNLSVDDGTMINHGPCGVAEGIVGDLSGVRFFNNTTIGASPTVSVQLGLSTEMFAPGGFLFANNLVYARTPIDAIPCGNHCSNNAFFNLPPSGSAAVTADPRLTGPVGAAPVVEAVDRFGLRWDSPLVSSGIPVPSGGAVDFFGAAVPATPAIGFAQTPGAAPDPPDLGPTKACLRARAERKRALKKTKALNRKVRKLRRKGVARKRVRPVVRKLKRSRAVVKRKHRLVRRNCAAG